MWQQKPSLVLTEQLLQVAALVEGFFAAAARAKAMPVTDVRTLLCMARLEHDGQQFSTPTELCELTGLPKNRIAEALARLSGDRLVEAWGTGSADRRTRAFKVTDAGQTMSESLVEDLATVELMLRYAMRTPPRARSMNLTTATGSLKKLVA